MASREESLAHSHPVERAAYRRVRPREHPYRLERRRELCLAGDPASRAAASGPRSSPDCSPKVRGFLALDRRDRSDFLRSFYRRYEGAPIDRLRLDGIELWSDLLGSALVSRRPRPCRGAPRASGTGRVLITGALDFVVEPLRPLFDEIDLRPSGRARRQVHRRARGRSARRAKPAHSSSRSSPARPGSSLDQIVAYADSTSDLPMLEAAGLPVAVNPEAKLAAIARRRGWSIEHWSAQDGRAGPAIAMLATSTMQPGLAHRRRTGGRGEGTRLRAQPRPLRRVPRRLRRSAGSGHGVACRPARARSRSTRRACPARAGCASRPASPASAAPTSRPSTAVRSRYFEHLVSFPFVPGHEVVGDVEGRCASTGAEPSSSPCSAARRAASTPLCAACAGGHKGACERIAFGHLRPGTADRLLHRHRWRLVRRARRPREPAARGTRRLLRRGGRHGRASRMRRARRLLDRVRRAAPASSCSAPARSDCARSPPCATSACRARSSPPPSTPSSASSPASSVPTRSSNQAEVERAARRLSGSLALGRRTGRIERLAGGVDVVYDCVGSPESLEQALAIVRPGGRDRPRRHARDRPGSTSPRCGSGRCELRGAYAYGTEARPEGPAPPSTSPSSSCRAAGLERLVSARLPARALRGGRRPRGRRRPPRVGKDRLRPASQAARAQCQLRRQSEPEARFRPRGRPVDPATLFWRGEGFGLEQLPVGSRVIYGPEPLPALRDPDAAIRHALEHPLGDTRPCGVLLHAGMKLTIAFDDISLPLPPMKSPGRAPARDRGRPRPGGRRPASTTSCSSPPWRCTGA